jgi:hypothetical protein
MAIIRWRRPGIAIFASSAKVAFGQGAWAAACKFAWVSARGLIGVTLGRSPRRAQTMLEVVMLLVVVLAQDWYCRMG